MSGEELGKKQAEDQIILPPETSLGKVPARENSDLVMTVEKISKIISPYFVALLGLYLYRDNGLLGTILIGIGMITLLKISSQDVVNLVVKVKELLGLNEKSNS
ncbi:MAG: hypothetical protein WA865_10785 [Spirulinaceae cyanobacterium]